MPRNISWKRRPRGLLPAVGQKRFGDNYAVYRWQLKNGVHLETTFTKRSLVVEYSGQQCDHGELEILESLDKVAERRKKLILTLLSNVLLAKVPSRTNSPQRPFSHLLSDIFLSASQTKRDLETYMYKTVNLSVLTSQVAPGQKVKQATWKKASINYRVWWKCRISHNRINFKEINSIKCGNVTRTSLTIERLIVPGVTPRHNWGYYSLWKYPYWLAGKKGVIFALYKDKFVAYEQEDNLGIEQLDQVMKVLK